MDTNKLHIIGIDPGYSTGIVMIQAPDEPITHMTFAGKSPIRYIRDMVFCFPKAIAVVEEEPRNGDPQQAVRVAKILTAIDREYHLILPGEWKPFAKAQGWVYKNAGSQHEQDAYCIARYYATFKVHK